MNTKYLQNDCIVHWVDSLLKLIAHETTHENSYPNLATKARDNWDEITCLFNMGSMRVVSYIVLLSWLNIECVKEEVSFFLHQTQAHQKSMIEPSAKIV